MAWDRNSAHYPHAVAQFDGTACWAAGLEWWLRCMKQSRALILQRDMRTRFDQFWVHQAGSEYGTVDGYGMGHIMDDSSINMDYVARAAGSWDKDFIGEKLAVSPVLIGYNEQEVGGFHVNIIHSLNDTASADVNVMDPNGGRYRTRSNYHFKSGNYLLGWAK